jgi:hypothetical protein
MDERIARVLRTIDDFERLTQFEENIRHQQAMTPEVEAALTEKAATLSRTYVAERKVARIELEALAHHAGQEATHRVLLPASCLHHGGNRRLCVPRT